MTRPTSPQSVGTSYAHMSSGGGRGVAAVVAGGARVWRRESDGMGPVTHHDVRVLAAALPPRQKGGGAGARARGWRELARPAPAARRCATASHAKKKQLAVTESRGQSRACVHCQAPLAAAGLRGVAENWLMVARLHEDAEEPKEAASRGVASTASASASAAATRGMRVAAHGGRPLGVLNA